MLYHCKGSKAQLYGFNCLKSEKKPSEKREGIMALAQKDEKSKFRFKICIVLLTSLLLAASYLESQQQPQKVEDLVSLIKEKSGLELKLEDIGWQWRDEDAKGTEEKGEITFADIKWLMYLIHWGPIQVEEITVDYVKERMLKMWGVPFEFSGKEGRTKMAGHDAVWVEAYGTNKMFYSRYIIWNCPESGREFIADTNYNIRVKTPKHEFETEMRSAKTIQCHSGAQTEHFPDLTNKYESEKYGFSFYYPEKWFMFESPYYVPFPEYDGIRNRKMGSLLGLCSDRGIKVTLKWTQMDESQDEEQVMGIQQKLMESLINEIKSYTDVESIQNSGMENFKVDDKKITRIWGSCQFIEPENENERQFFTGKGIYQVAQWNQEKKKIMVILTTKQYRYGSVASSPVRSFLDEFSKDFIPRIH